MKKELDYFTIEGCYGGNQDWFTNLVMHMGGCAAATACDSCIYFGLQNEKMKPLYPFDIECLTKEDIQPDHETLPQTTCWRCAEA